MRSYKPASQQPQQAAVANSADTLVGLIRNFKGEIEAALPKHITAERMTRIIMTEVRKNPKLAECDKASFFGAILECSQLGLEPGAALGHAFLSPVYVKGKLEVQLTLGYQGMVDLAERSGKVTLHAEVVYENDEFDIDLGLNPMIKHKPEIMGERGDVIGAYAVATYVDGRKKFRFINKADIEKARGAAKTDYIWKGNFAEMARKTAVRRLFKMLPKSPEMGRAQEIEERIEIGAPQEMAKAVPDEVSNLLAPPIDITEEEETVIETKKDTEKKDTKKTEVKNDK
jgi:recombination protein RecT